MAKKKTSSRSVLIESERRLILSKDSSFYSREAYNTLRTNLGFALAEAPKHRVFCVTSAMQSEGKSITAVNLAISLAEAGNKVMIVDADLRRPKLSRLFQERGDKGLSDALANASLTEQAVHRYRELDVILSGSIPPNPSELLGSNAMKNLLTRLRQEYDYVVIDTPPITMVTDAVVLAPATDGLLFVVRSGISDRGSVRFALDQLSYANAKVLGFVMNGVPIESTNYGYSKYKYRKYGHYGYKKYGYNGGYSAGYGGYGYGYSRPKDKLND